MIVVFASFVITNFWIPPLSSESIDHGLQGDLRLLRQVVLIVVIPSVALVRFVNTGQGVNKGAVCVLGRAGGNGQQVWHLDLYFLGGRAVGAGGASSFDGVNACHFGRSEGDLGLAIGICCYLGST